MGTRCVIWTEHVRKLFLSVHKSEFDANCQTCHVGRFKFEVGTRSGWNWRKLGANINRYSGHQEEASGKCNALNAIFFWHIVSLQFIWRTRVGVGWEWGYFLVETIFSVTGTAIHWTELILVSLMIKKNLVATISNMKSCKKNNQFKLFRCNVCFRHIYTFLLFLSILNKLSNGQ